MSTLALKSTRVVHEGKVEPATVIVRDGRIVEVARYQDEVPGLQDLGELVLSPGLVDCHVHVNEPGRTDWEGFETATRAAAAGGVTSLVDMPLNCIPVTTSASALEAKLTACSGKLYVDTGFWGGVVPGNAGELAGLARTGALGCKAFLVHSGIDEFPNATEADLRLAMPVLRDHGLPLLAHAELDLGAPAWDTSRRAYGNYLASRPPAWEVRAIELLIDLCRETRCAVHIVHLSAAQAVDALRAAKDEGLPITVETCPHYLCLEAESIPDGATHFKCAPPIREHENREALWRALFEGVIDFVISDHSPCTPHLKLPERGDFHDAWGGIASLQLGLPAIWSQAAQRGATLSQLSAWMSAAPARFAGQSGRKGRIARGHDADLVVWDPDASVLVAPETLFFRHKVSPYLGQTLKGRVQQTWLRGRKIYDLTTGHDPIARGQPLLHRREAP
ncbi:MAG TPA: allantoinase AllB [Polyangiales bacterium]